MCNIVKVISSEPSDKSYLPINKAVTNGTVAIGKLKNNNIDLLLIYLPKL